jgi:hypothetical protein
MRILTFPSAGLTKFLAVLRGCAVEPMVVPGGVGTGVGVGGSGVGVGVGVGGGDVGVGVGVGGGDVGVGRGAGVDAGAGWGVAVGVDPSLGVFCTALFAAGDVSGVTVRRRVSGVAA